MKIEPFPGGGKFRWRNLEEYTDTMLFLCNKMDTNIQTCLRRGGFRGKVVAVRRGYSGPEVMILVKVLLR